MKMIKECRVLEEDGKDLITMYWRFKMPLMNDRDNILRITREDVEGGKQFVHCVTVERDDTPEIPGVQRMFTQLNGLLAPSAEYPDCLEYTEISYFDIKGSVPARLLNMVIANMAKGEFMNIYESIKKKQKA